MTTDLPINLQHLCANHPSVAAVCREIGINHQQFSKYLSGRSQPSPNNLRRIARFFGVEETVLLGPHPELRRQTTRTARSRTELRRDPLIDAFPGDFSRLRAFLGSYRVFFCAPNDPSKVVVNAAFLDERDGLVFSRVVETLVDSRSSARRWTRCDGKASFTAGQLFIVDKERGTDAPLSLYILNKQHRDRSGNLFGTMSYLASLAGRQPTSSAVVWAKVRATTPVRNLFQDCGIYELHSQIVPPKVKQFLTNQT
jgi:transcriptional regulator with XRE-family HTH domain